MGGLNRRRRAGLALVALAVLAESCQHTPRTGVVHVVRRGETVYGIARHYRVPVTDVLESNEIADVRSLAVGTQLWIPGAAPEKRRRATPTSGEARPGRPRPADESRPDVRLAWPLRGRLTSRFGQRNGRMHEGIDLAARPGSLIRAAAAGRVIFSRTLGGYGRVVVVRHDERFSTVYAHNRRNRVRRGQYVERGAVLAEVGASGNASGPHLHFEVRRFDRAEDPLRYLP